MRTRRWPKKSQLGKEKGTRPSPKEKLEKLQAQER